MNNQESCCVLEQIDFSEKWKIESKKSNQESSTATPANTPIEGAGDKSLVEQVRVYIQKVLVSQ